MHKNESAQLALNILFSSETFIFLDLSMVILLGIKKFKLHAGGCRTSAVVMYILSGKKYIKMKNISF